MSLDFYSDIIQSTTLTYPASGPYSSPISISSTSNDIPPFYIHSTAIMLPRRVWSLAALVARSFAFQDTSPFFAFSSTRSSPSAILQLLRSNYLQSRPYWLLLSSRDDFSCLSHHDIYQHLRSVMPLRCLCRGVPAGHVHFRLQRNGHHAAPRPTLHRRTICHGRDTRCRGHD